MEITKKDIQWMQDEKVDREQFGSRIKSFRKKVKLTQGQVAELISLHRTNYGHAERGEFMMHHDNLYRLAKFYRKHGLYFSLDYVYGLEENKMIHDAETHRQLNDLERKLQETEAQLIDWKDLAKLYKSELDQCRQKVK